MLAFVLNRSDLVLDWQPTAHGWTAGGCRIEPFRHPALEDFAIATDGRLLVVVRERCAGVAAPHRTGASCVVPHVEPQIWDDTIAECIEWPLQMVVLIVSADEGAPIVTIVSGSWGTAPIFVVARGESLFGHWDAARLYAHLRKPYLDEVLAVHFLATFETPYARATLFPDIRLLTERSRARWTVDSHGRAELDIAYPPAVHPLRARRLKPDVDVLGAFWNILTSSMRRWWPENQRGVGAELSGGLDSGIVSAAASSLVQGRPLDTYGLILSGEVGERQQSRRRTLIERFGLDDQALDLGGFLPLAPGSNRLVGGRVVPWEECYYEAVDAMLAGAAEKGTRLLFTGFGGDELCEVREGARDFKEVDPPREIARGLPKSLPPFLSQAAVQAYRDGLDGIDRAPTSPISSSSIEAAAQCASLYLNRGIWPVHPLCTPELVRFCQMLPREWREGRAVERRLLDRLGCSPNLTQPQEPDSFSPALAAAFRRDGRPEIEWLFRESRLAELGWVDREQLVTSYTDWCNGVDLEGSVPFYAAAVLELTLRQIETALRETG
jgi:asparagine synthase (glutamine-hydrolysing)